MTKCIPIISRLFGLGKLINIKLTLIFALVNQVMRNLNGLVGVEHCVFVFVDLTQERTNLHVGLAAVLEHLEFQGWLLWVVEVFLKIVAFEVFDTCF